MKRKDKRPCGGPSSVSPSGCHLPPGEGNRCGGDNGRKLIEAAGWAALVLALGVLGGTECGTLPLGRGAAEAVGLMLAGAWMLWKGGVLRI